MILVLTGKTASGKDTIMAKLLFKFPDFRRVITTTSRLPRDGEAEGVDYFFLSKEDFYRKITNGDFIEYVSYGGNLYGTEKSQITTNLNQNLIWRIDPSRAGQIKKLFLDSFEKSLAEDLFKKTVVIYLTVADEIVLKRLQERGLDQQEIQQRMMEDAGFWQQYKDRYDFVIENVPDILSGTIDQVIQIIKNHRS